MGPWEISINNAFGCELIEDFHLLKCNYEGFLQQNFVLKKSNSLSIEETIIEKYLTIYLDNK